MKLTGLHHVTAVTADAPGNVAFYTEVLGLRMVKKTVNQDDVSAYHLFYADGKGSPGTDMTFFDWPAAPDRRGGDSISRTAFRVAGTDTLDWWADRFASLGVAHGEVGEWDGRACLDFEDPEGQRLRLVDDGGAGEACPWDRSPVPVDRQIRGLGPVTLTVSDLDPTHRMLSDLLGMRAARRHKDPASPEHEVHVYEMGDGGPAAELHVAVRPDLPKARLGRGGVHHLALRTPDDASYDAWADRLKATRTPFSGKVDRFYFRSLYFREPHGILFEIATDGPGFDVDEPLDSLGEGLSLPPFLEHRRAEIEAGLKPL